MGLHFACHVPVNLAFSFHDLETHSATQNSKLITV